MKLWNTSRYLFSQCKIYNLSISFFLTREHQTWSPPKFTVCWRQLVLHNSRVFIYTDCDVNGSLHSHSSHCTSKLYNAVALSSLIHLYIPFVLVADCIACSSGLMHDCYPGSSLTVIVNFLSISFCVLFPVFWVLAFPSSWFTMTF